MLSHSNNLAKYVYRLNNAIISWEKRKKKPELNHGRSVIWESCPPTKTLTLYWIFCI